MRHRWRTSQCKFAIRFLVVFTVVLYYFNPIYFVMFVPHKFTFKFEKELHELHERFLKFSQVSKGCGESEFPVCCNDASTIYHSFLKY